MTRACSTIPSKRVEENTVEEGSASYQKRGGTVSEWLMGYGDV